MSSLRTHLKKCAARLSDCATVECTQEYGAESMDALSRRSLSISEADVRLFRRPAEASYRAGVDRQERVFAITAAAEAMFLAFGALVAFLTPSERSEHNMVLSVALLSLAAPLVWHAAMGGFNETSQADPLMLRVIIPNAVLLLMCFGGLLQSSTDGYGPWPALVAAVAATIIAAALRSTPHRLPAGARS